MQVKKAVAITTSIHHPEGGRATAETVYALLG